MALWSKGVERSLTGEERLENQQLNMFIISTIKQMFNHHLYTHTGETELCTYHITGKYTIEWMFGTSIIYQTIEPPKCNFPFIMQHLLSKMEDYNINHPGNRPLFIIHQELQSRKNMFIKTGDEKVFLTNW